MNKKFKCQIKADLQNNNLHDYVVKNASWKLGWRRSINFRKGFWASSITNNRVISIIR